MPGDGRDVHAERKSRSDLAPDGHLGTDAAPQCQHDGEGPPDQRPEPVRVLRQRRHAGDELSHRPTADRIDRALLPHVELLDHGAPDGIGHPLVSCVRAVVGSGRDVLHGDRRQRHLLRVCLDRRDEQAPEGAQVRDQGEAGDRREHQGAHRHTQKRFPDIVDIKAIRENEDFFERYQDDWVQTVRTIALQVDATHEELGRSFITPADAPPLGEPEPEIEPLEPREDLDEEARRSWTKLAFLDGREVVESKEAVEFHDYLHSISRLGSDIDYKGPPVRQPTDRKDIERPRTAKGASKAKKAAKKTTKKASKATKKANEQTPPPE